MPAVKQIRWARGRSSIVKTTNSEFGHMAGCGFAPGGAKGGDRRAPGGEGGGRSAAGSVVSGATVKREEFFLFDIDRCLHHGIEPHTVRNPPRTNVALSGWYKASPWGREQGGRGEELWVRPGRGAIPRGAWPAAPEILRKPFRRLQAGRKNEPACARRATPERHFKRGTLMGKRGTTIRRPPGLEGSSPQPP